MEERLNISRKITSSEKDKLFSELESMKNILSLDNAVLGNQKDNEFRQSIKERIMQIEFSLEIGVIHRRQTDLFSNLLYNLVLLRKNLFESEITEYSLIQVGNVLGVIKSLLSDKDFTDEVAIGTFLSLEYRLSSIKKSILCEQLGLGDFKRSVLGEEFKFSKERIDEEMEIAVRTLEDYLKSFKKK